MLPGNYGRCFCFFVFQVLQCYGWENRDTKHNSCYNIVVMGAVDVPKERNRVKLTEFEQANIVTVKRGGNTEKHE